MPGLHAASLNELGDLVNNWIFEKQYERTKAAMSRYGRPDSFRMNGFRRDIESMQQQWRREDMDQWDKDEAEQQSLVGWTKGVSISKTDV